MHRTLLFTLTTLVFVFTASSTYGANLGHGKKLHDAHCTACHIGMTGGDGSVIYMRKDRRVESVQALEKQVRRCETSQQLKWLNEDIEDVVQYLNDTYYQFERD